MSRNRETIMGAELRNIRRGFAEVWKDEKCLGVVHRVGRTWFPEVFLDQKPFNGDGSARQDEAVHEILKHFGISYRNKLRNKP